MTRDVRAALRRLDYKIAKAALRVRRERPALIAFLLHGLFENAEELERGLVDPYQPTLLADLARLIEHFAACGYRFASPSDVLAGLDPTGYHALLTFDDGYANNRLALPVLHRFGVPATFFVSSKHIAEQRAFWWDVVYRERRKRGAAGTAIRREVQTLKRRRHGEIDSYLREVFGSRALDPAGDIDRPLSPAELKEMAADPLVSIGNHTADHAILTVCDENAARAQIRACQAYVENLTGERPDIIAYPDGAHDERVLGIARSEGLRLGAIVEPRKNRLPLDDRAAMTMTRCFIRADGRVADECRSCRSDVQLRNLLRPLKTMIR